MDATAYYAIGIPLYIVLFGVESAIARARGRGPSLTGSVSNICTGLGAIVVGMIVGPLMVALYDWAYRTFALLDLDALGFWPVFAIAVVLGDLGNYWRHRLEHRCAVLWAVHGVHHSPTEMNLSVGMRHAWLSDTYAFPFYAALPLLGIPTAQFFLAMVALTLYALFTHSREYNFPSLGILVTPRTHAVHHAINARYVDKNYGALLVIWDRLFGTYAPYDPADPPVFGTARGSETHDGALAQLVLFGELGRLARATRGAAAKLRVLLGVPTQAAPVVAPPPAAHAARVYAIVQLVLLVVFAAHVFSIPTSERGFAAAGAVLIVATIVGIGGLLDARRGARIFEAVRFGVFVPAAAMIVIGSWSATWG